MSAGQDPAAGRVDEIETAVLPLGIKEQAAPAAVVAEGAGTRQHLGPAGG